MSALAFAFSSTPSPATATPPPATAHGFHVPHRVRVTAAASSVDSRTSTSVALPGSSTRSCVDVR
jgi:hypothetical protein